MSKSTAFCADLSKYPIYPSPFSTTSQILIQHITKKMRDLYVLPNDTFRFPKRYITIMHNTLQNFYTSTILKSRKR